MLAGCVVPPPLTVQDDGGVNAPPNITNVTDPSFNSHRPPDRITIDNDGSEEMTVTVVDIDHDDDLFVQIFVDYALKDPKVDANVNCPAPPTGTDSRTTSCNTTALCGDLDVDLHTMEIEVYDREPKPSIPWRDTDGYFATWTFELQCQEISL
jgi:hypothetical protein